MILDESMSKTYEKGKVSVCSGIKILYMYFQIQNELVKERATALKEQEVKLAALMAQLQMEKAKEVSLSITSVRISKHQLIVAHFRKYAVFPFCIPIVL